MSQKKKATRAKLGLTISGSLGAKLAAIVVHADEYFGPEGHDYDRDALAALLTDAEVIAWLRDIGPLAPHPRGRTYSNSIGSGS